MIANTLSVTLRTHNSSRIADLEVDSSVTPSQLIAECTRRWSLPAVDYTMSDERLGLALDADARLDESGVLDGDALVLYPQILAGAQPVAVADPRVERLRSTEGAMRELAAAPGSAFAILSTHGTPARSYKLRLRAKGVESVAPNGVIVFRSTHDLVIELGPRYPLEAPRVRFLTPILHPHVHSDGSVCLGEKTGASERLIDLVRRLDALIRWDPRYIDPTSPARLDALKWRLRVNGPLGDDVAEVPAATPPRLIWAERSAT